MSFSQPPGVCSSQRGSPEARRCRNLQTGFKVVADFFSSYFLAHLDVVLTTSHHHQEDLRRRPTPLTSHNLSVGGAVFSLQRLWLRENFKEIQSHAWVESAGGRKLPPAAKCCQSPRKYPRNTMIQLGHAHCEVIILPIVHVSLRWWRPQGTQLTVTYNNKGSENNALKTLQHNPYFNKHSVVYNESTRVSDYCSR